MADAVEGRRGEGWLLFAAVIMVTAGVMRVLDALWAFDKDDEVSERLQVVIFDDNLAAYGWLWLIVGVLLIVAGFAVLSGAPWARWFGIVMAGVAAVTAMLWIFEFPTWSLVHVLIAIGVLVGLTSDAARVRA